HRRHYPSLPPCQTADRIARGGQAYRRPAARAVEQRLPQCRLQRRDLVRERGLREAERGGRGPERPEFGDGKYRLELAQPQPAFDRLYRSQPRHFLTFTHLSLTLNWLVPE